MQTTREELLAKIEKRELESVTLVHGEEPFFTDEVVSALRAVYKDVSGWGFEVVDAQTLDARGLAASAATLAFDSGTKVTVVRSASRLRKDQLEVIEKIASRQAKERAVVLLADKEGKAVDALVKWAKERKIMTCQLQSLKPAEMTSWLKAESTKRGFSVDEETQGFMLDLSSGNLLAMSQILDKLDLFRGGKTKVYFKDVEDLLADSFEKGVYDCVRAVFERNRDKAAKEMKRVLRFGTGQGITELLYALSRETFTLLKYQLLKEKGLSKDALGKELRLGSRAWLLNKEYPERARNWPKEKLERLLHRLADVDIATRITGRDAEAMLEQIVIGNLAPTSVEDFDEIFV